MVGSTTHDLYSHVVDLSFLVLLLSPKSEVLLEKLNDALGIAEVVLLELIDLVESLLESVVSEIAGLLVVLHDLVVEDREVKGKTELDGVAGRKGDGIGFVIGLKCLVLDGLKLVFLGVLGDVAVVVTDHLHEESLGLVLTVVT